MGSAVGSVGAKLYDVLPYLETPSFSSLFFDPIQKKFASLAFSNASYSLKEKQLVWAILREKNEIQTSYVRSQKALHLLKDYRAKETKGLPGLIWRCIDAFLNWWGEKQFQSTASLATDLIATFEKVPLTEENIPYPKTEEELKNAFREELRKELYEEFKKECAAEIKKELTTEIREELEKELRESIEKELQDKVPPPRELDTDLRASIEKELREFLEKQIRAELESRSRWEFVVPKEPIVNPAPQHPPLVRRGSSIIKQPPTTSERPPLSLREKIHLVRNCGSAIVTQKKNALEHYTRMVRPGSGISAIRNTQNQTIFRDVKAVTIEKSESADYTTSVEGLLMKICDDGREDFELDLNDPRAIRTVKDIFSSKEALFTNDVIQWLMKQETLNQTLVSTIVQALIANLENAKRIDNYVVQQLYETIRDKDWMSDEAHELLIKLFDLEPNNDKYREYMEWTTEHKSFGYDHWRRCVEIFRQREFAKFADIKNAMVYPALDILLRQTKRWELEVLKDEELVEYLKFRGVLQEQRAVVDEPS